MCDPWQGYFTSLRLSFLTCKMGSLTPNSVVVVKIKWTDGLKALGFLLHDSRLGHILSTTITSHAVDLKMTECGTAHIGPVFICSLLSEAVRT